MTPTEESIKEAIDYIINAILELKSQRYIEFEFRLGHVFSDYFQTEITKKHFNMIKEALDHMDPDTFRKIEKEYTVEYDIDSRRRIDDIIIKKSTISNINFSIDNSPFDVRLGISKEQPVKLFKDKEITKTMNKKRTSYIYKIWTYDLTITDNSIYSIEIELDPKSLKTDDTAQLKKIIYSTLMKINDLSKLVENSEPGKYTRS